MAKPISCSVCGHGPFEPKPTKNGGYSASCPNCGTQTFAKSPKAAGFLTTGTKDDAGGQVRADVRDDFNRAIFGGDK